MVTYLDLIFRPFAQLGDSFELRLRFEHGCNALHVLFELDDEFWDDGWDVVPLVRRVLNLAVDQRVFDPLTLQLQHEFVLVGPGAGIPWLWRAL